MPRNSTGKTVRDFYFLHEMLDSVNKILSYLTMMSLNCGFYYFKLSKRRKFLNRQACMILYDLL